jgi:hypothetical protein
MAGLNRTLHFKPRINPGGDGVRVERLQKNPDFLYHRIVVMSNGGTDVSNNPKIIGPNFPVWPSYRICRKSATEMEMVSVAGGSFSARLSC